MTGSYSYHYSCGGGAINVTLAGVGLFYWGLAYSFCSICRPLCGEYDEMLSDKAGATYVLPKDDRVSLFIPQFTAAGIIVLRALPPSVVRKLNINILIVQNITCVICRTREIGLAMGYDTGVLLLSADTSNVS